jgi:uncharacterized Zn finger protein (UPF0148 family)
MKVCETCGVEISTRDGENECVSCDAKVRKSAKRRQARKEKAALMASLGLVKVKGALGGTYWE